MTAAPLKLFISYSHKDESLREELGSHLRILEREQLIAIWQDRKILAGDEWDHQINTNLETADIILLLISSDFLASSYCWDIEIQRAMQLHESGQTCVIPVILRSVDWTSAPFGKLQAVPRNAQPVTLQPDRDAAFEFVTKQIRQAATELLQKRLKQREQEQKAEAIARYRKQFEEFAADSEINDAERFVLDDLKGKLNLSDAEVQAIEQNLLRPPVNQQALDQYRQFFEKLVAKYGYPFGEKGAGELRVVQEHLRLTDADVAPILAEKEAEYQNQQRLELERQQEEKRQRQQALEQQRQEEERQQQQALEQQRQLEAQRHEQERQEQQRQQQAAAAQQQKVIEQERSPAPSQSLPSSSTPPLQPFEFQVATLVVNRSGLLGMNVDYTVNRRPGQASCFVEDLGNGIRLEMVKILGGTFQMGSPANEKERASHEGPQHKVTIQPFFMGKFTVTQAQWKAIASLPKVKIDLNPDPSNFKGSNCPVEKISWHEAVEFCDRLSRKTNRKYRLPSEAEWEYACRAGTTTPFHFGETITTDIVNYDGNYTYGSAPKGEYRQTTLPIGSFKIANAFGLYDMHGNVWEWCADHWHENYQGAPTDGSAWITGGDGDRRLLRGGSWYDYPGSCRSADRDRYVADDRVNGIGFRLALSLPGL